MAAECCTPETELVHASGLQEEDSSATDAELPLKTPRADPSLLLGKVEYNLYLGLLIGITIAAWFVNVAFTCPGEDELLPAFDALTASLSALAGMFYADFARKYVASTYQHLAGIYFVVNTFACTAHASLHVTMCRDVSFIHMITMICFIVGTSNGYLVLQHLILLKVEALGSVPAQGWLAPRSWRWVVGFSGCVWAVAVLVESTIIWCEALETFTGLLFAATFLAYSALTFRGFWLASKVSVTAPRREAHPMLTAVFFRDVVILWQAVSAMLANGMTILLVLAALYENSSYTGEVSMHMFLVLNCASVLSNTVCATSLSGVLYLGRRSVDDEDEEEGNLHDMLITREENLVREDMGDMTGCCRRFRVLIGIDGPI
eukprot:TRINITY_DN19086_c0_g1_i4.p1 TRINITY_DN19086_c0_g1~~TRINITY_DN19086_c0_g1_i4.p1  ORF type:complete len:389 (+),score=35.73 TRINITY_DN19086_c0_g1_i4:40-1167(+)